jgi:PAS domain S-box-containing protein
MRRLRSVIESSGASMVLTDRDLRILLVNREFANLHGLTVEEAVGRPLGDIADVTLDRSVLDRWLSGVLESGDIEVVRYSKTKTGADGVPRIYNLTAKPVTDETGFVRQIVFLGVDDTERREAERALADAERLATVGEMAATVVHEISQPLQVISVAAVSALDEVAAAAERGNTPDAAYLKRRLERISQQVERTASIIHDLRGFVRSTFSDKAAPFDVAEAVSNAVDLASHALRRSRITLLSRIGEHVPPVVGYSNRLEQVLINLINNARDARASTIEIFADTIQHEGRRFVRLAVEDTGLGISQEVLPHLFRKFVTNKPRGEGTGLGLRICRRIVEEMGGTIAAGNRPEGGARFEILLPAVEGAR